MVSRESNSSHSGRPARRSEARAKKQGRRAKPLDETGLRDLALSYVARFATTGAKLEQYCARKIRERGVAEDEDGRTRDLDVTGMITRFIELGYIDDAAYARSKSRDLTARGFGARRVEQALWAAGVEEGVREETAPGEGESRRAAAVLARKRRFGPYAMAGDEEPSSEERHKKREKQVAAMLRAGHLYDHVRFILEAANEDAIEEWIEEGDEYAD